VKHYDPLDPAQEEKQARFEYGTNEQGLRNLIDKDI
jgi:hypothetical protein